MMPARLATRRTPGSCSRGSSASPSSAPGGYPSGSAWAYHSREPTLSRRVDPGYYPQWVGEERSHMSWRGPTAAIAGAIALWGCVLWLGPGAGASQASDERVALVMTKLPPPGSSQYQAIRKRAGEVVVQPLRLTKAEAWSVPKASAEAATKAAAAQGVEVTTLAANWNHIFAPAPAGTAMTAEQRAMVQRAMASPAAAGIATFLPPRAA